MDEVQLALHTAVKSEVPTLTEDTVTFVPASYVQDSTHSSSSCFSLGNKGVLQDISGFSERIELSKIIITIMKIISIIS